MSKENKNNVEVDEDSGWFSEPSIEFVIEPPDKDMGIFERTFSERLYF